PAIGSGTTAVTGVTTDQRGLIRGRTVDIGAFQTTLVVESTDGSVGNTTDPSTLTLPGAVSLANQFAGPIVISFAPSFSGGQVINLAGKLELTNQAGTQTIKGPGPAVTVTVSGGANRAFQVDKNVTATITGLTIKSDLAANGA